MRLLTKVNNARHTAQLVAALEVFYVAAVTEGRQWGVDQESREGGGEVCVGGAWVLHPSKPCRILYLV